jgi:hypothetical protein
MSTSFERREHLRNEIFETRKIEYSMHAFNSETFEGIVLNINDSGICLLISDRFSIGQEIILRDVDIYGSSKAATLQWIEKVDSGKYRAGLIFS